MSVKVDSEMEPLVAVVGMSCRYPGASDPREFWRNLRDGVESITQLTDAELEGVVPPELLRDPAYVKSAAVLDEIDSWDAPFFGFNPKEAALMDPQHRILLECAWEALEDSGHVPESFQGSIGVFAGCGMQSYFSQNLLPNRALMQDVGYFLVRHTGNDKDFLATRISYCFNLRGPSIGVQTACSTSLVAIHIAAQSVLNGECDMALAGAASIELPHRVGYLFREGEILSPDGHCRAFDAASQGTVFGSGAGMVALRRLEDAVADGDHVYAVIRASAVNNDGSSKVGYLAPSVEGQSAAAAEALAMAGIDPRSVTFLEAHGTGTPIGDPIEIAGLAQAYASGSARAWCGIGSVKSNIGHLDTAAGVASFSKVALALENELMPASLHFSAPNPALNIDTTPFFINAAPKPWPRAALPRRAAVSSLGVGGTNAHVILEEAPALSPSGTSRERQLFVLSARSRDALAAAADNLAQHLGQFQAGNIADVAFTLREGRRSFGIRRAFVARNAADAVNALRAADAAARPVSAPSTSQSVAFMFAGGGAQRPGMGRSLYESEKSYSDAVDRCLALLEPNVAGDVRTLLLTDAPDAQMAAEMERPSRALPALFITQYAMAQLFGSWGITPSAMIGHSMGEYTAAHLAGVFSLSDALRLVSLRGKLFERVEKGGMLSVPLPGEKLREHLDPRLSIAAMNAPDLSVASGPVDALHELERRLAAQGIESTRVRIDVAAHSGMLDVILDEFHAFLRTVQLNEPRVPFVSNLSGDWIPSSDACDPEYWVRHLRNTVLFSPGVSRLLEDENRVLLELGPGRTLATLARLQSRAANRSILTSMRAHEDVSMDDADAALLALGQLWCSGVDVSWTKFRGAEQRRRVSLPTYPFERERHWIDAPQNISEPPATTPTGRLPVAEWFYAPEWERIVAPPPAAKSRAGALTVLLDDGSALGDALARELSQHVVNVVRVGRGAQFARHSEVSYSIDPASAADFERMIASVGSKGPSPLHVIHMWSQDPADVPQHDPAAQTHREERSFYSLMHLAQGWGRAGIAAGSSLTVVSVNMRAVGGESPAAPWKSLSLGPLRVIPSEFPELAARSIDLSRQDLSESLRKETVALLADELLAAGRPPEVAIRRREFWRESYTRIAVSETPPRVGALRDEGVYIITGGVGGIGLHIATELAQRCRARLVLVGRNATDDVRSPSRNGRGAAIRAAIEQCERAGAVVHLIPADISDIDDARRVVSGTVSRFGAIHGVFHAAGSLNDGLILTRSDEESAAILSAKVRGTGALDEALGDRPLDFLVLFSSISAIAGLPGQADYAAANAFLDAFATERSARAPGTTMSIQWAAWRGVGMTGSTREADGMSSRAGAHPYLRELVQDEPGKKVFESAVSTGKDWLVSEHRLRNGTALVPGTGLLEIASAAAATAKSGASPIELSDVAFLAPLVVSDTTAGKYRVVFKQNGGRASFVLVTEDESGWIEIASGSAGEPAAIQKGESLSALRNRFAQPGTPLPPVSSHPHLALGKRWDCLREVRYAGNEALAYLELHEEFTSDVEQLRMHPALLDMATACALPLLPGYDLRRDFYVPMGYSRLVSVRPLTPKLYSHVRLAATEMDVKEVCAFDIDLYSTDGELLVAIEGFLMTRVTDVGAMLRGSSRRRGYRFDTPPKRKPDVAPSGAGQLADAITPAEGVSALMRLIESRAPSNVAVSWINVPDLVRQLREPHVSRRSAAVAAPERLDDVEAALRAHTAVDDCAVIMRRDRTGEQRMVCYVVFRRGGHATVSDLRKFVKHRTPGKRPPSNFVAVDAIPRTDSGQADPTMLPDPFGVADDHVAPRTEVEKVIADSWCEALGIQRVSVHDNFFDIGGHSLLAVRVVTKLDRTLGVRLSQAIMVLQTLEQIAAECERQMASKGNGGNTAQQQPRPRGLFGGLLRSTGSD